MFLNAKKKETREDTFISYNSHLKMFIKYCKKIGIENKFITRFTKTMALDYLTDKYKENIMERTYNNYLKFYVLFFNWLKDYEYVAKNPFETIKRKGSTLELRL